MDTKILTKEEKEKIIENLKVLLDSYKPTITISNDPYVVLWEKGCIDGHCTEGNVYIYQIIIDSSAGNMEITRSVNDGQSLERLAWLIAWEFFHKYDNNFEGELAKKLWEKK